VVGGLVLWVALAHRKWQSMHTYLLAPNSDCLVTRCSYNLATGHRADSPHVPSVSRHLARQLKHLLELWLLLLLRQQKQQISLVSCGPYTVGLVPAIRIYPHPACLYAGDCISNFWWTMKTSQSMHMGRFQPGECINE
jgi:hypothetical protein